MWKKSRTHVSVELLSPTILKKIVVTIAEKMVTFVKLLHLPRYTTVLPRIQFLKNFQSAKNAFLTFAKNFQCSWPIWKFLKCGIAITRAFYCPIIRNKKEDFAYFLRIRGKFFSEALLLMVCVNITERTPTKFSKRKKKSRPSCCVMFAWW